MHIHNTSTKARLIFTIALNFIITIAEIIGGILSGSLALLSDALHNFSDSIALIITYIALKLKQRERSYRHTFGLKRAEVLAAVINSSILVAISLYLFYEAGVRFYKPEPINSTLMIIIAVIGLFANLAGTFLLKQDSHHSTNIKSAYLHLLTDAISSVAVILGGIAIYFINITWIDPLLTILIGIYILKESYSILIESIHILMEGAPEGVSLDEVKIEVEKIKSVHNIHHAHLWMVGENDIHLEAHINIDDMLISKSNELRSEIEKTLKQKFNIRHITLQFECNQCPNDGLIKTNNV
jgi:cobalt-zinc-cadmium efflux system protein